VKIIADENIPFIKDCFSSIGQVTLSSGRDINADLASDADVLLVRSITKIDQSLLEKSRVKFVATATIGTEHIDTKYLRESGIGFAYAPGSNANSVAEYVIAALLALAKKHKFELDGKSIGIIGVGNVGSKVAQKAAALGMNVLLNDPPLQRQSGSEKYLPLHRLFDCDFISLHTPLTFEGQDKTFHLADDGFFSSLKDGAFFINTARGGCCDTQALKGALRSKHLGGAVIDVWEDEPNIDAELILKADLATPHIAGYSFDGKVAGVSMIYNATCEHFGIEPKYKAGDFLPAPELALITIDETADNEQTIIHDTVQQLYTINRDDFNTREILIVPPDERGQFFDDLRKNYPVRREFANTKLTFNDPACRLAEKLNALGFKV